MHTTTTTTTYPLPSNPPVIHWRQGGLLITVLFTNHMAEKNWSKSFSDFCSLDPIRICLIVCSFCDGGRKKAHVDTFLLLLLLLSLMLSSDWRVSCFAAIGTRRWKTGLGGNVQTPPGHDKHLQPAEAAAVTL